MIGLGVGDYALFVVTASASTCTRDAGDRGGRPGRGQAVLFAGATVVIAIVGLVLAGCRR